MPTDFSTFEQLYLTVRKKENRVYSNEKVSELPYLNNKDPHYKEWQLRAKTLNRFTKYLDQHHTNSNLLEIGCGNGWFSNRCADHVKKVIGIDVNKEELEQAKQVFSKKNLSFYYWDVFTDQPFSASFDLIVLNAVIQYFSDIEKLVDRLKELLNPNGEIHIIDSPFYTPDEVAAAKKRTKEYYQNTGVPKMAEHYYHHVLTGISDFECLYTPSNYFILKRLKARDSPFPWFRLKQ